MLSCVTTAAVRGVESFLVRVEVNLSSGLPAFMVVGLAEGAVREGRERVGAALRNVGFPLPPRRIDVNLAPADVRKEGSAFDLAVAVGLLARAATSTPHVWRAPRSSASWAWTVRCVRFVACSPWPFAAPARGCGPWWCPRTTRRRRPWCGN